MIAQEAKKAHLLGKAEFISILQSDERLRLSDYAVDKISDFLHALGDSEADLRILTEVIADLSLMQKSRIYAPEVFNLLLEAVTREVKAKITKLCIKDFKGTRFEELEILKIHFLNKRLKDLDLEWLLKGEDINAKKPSHSAR